MVNPQFTFVIQNKDNTLRIICDPRDKAEILECREKNDEISAFKELTESYWTNGWGVFSADELGQMSECEIIAGDATIEEDGSYSLYGRVWYHPDYQVESMIEVIVEKGFIVLPLWKKFDKPETFKNPYALK